MKNQNGQVNTVKAETLIERVREHNAQITNIPEKYKTIKPMNLKVLVKMFYSEGNIAEFETIQKVGKSETKQVVNPFPYSFKAIVINSYSPNYKFGDIVLLDSQALAKSGNYEFGKLPVYLFLNEDFREEGYLAIPEHLINFVIGTLDEYITDPGRMEEEIPTENI